MTHPAAAAELAPALALQQWLWPQMLAGALALQRWLCSCTVAVAHAAEASACA
jgi:hypothetical protein